MSTLKTQENDASAKEFITTIEDETRRKDGLVLLDLFTRVTGEQPRMWGTSIIGFGKYHYKSERSSQEGDWPLVAFSPRKQNLTLYVMAQPQDYSGILDTLGKHKTSKGCLYINRLSDIDLPTLETLVKQTFADAKKLHGQI